MSLKIAAGLLFALVALFPTTAHAGTAYANYQYSSANGYSYSYRASAGASGYSASGGIHVNVQNGKTAPTGYIGEYVRLYKTGGNLVASNGWAYNGSPKTSYSTYAGYTGTGTFYAYGYARFFNGSGYSGSPTSITPNVQNTAAASPTLSQQLSPIQSGEDNIRIPAEGINGRCGYVNSSDLDSGFVPSTPEEAVAYTLGQPDVRYVPIYDYDGTNIVDQLPVYCCYMEDVA